LTKYVAGEVTLSQYETLTFKSGVLLPVYVAAFLVVIAILARNLNSSVKKVNKTVYAQAKLVLLAFVACALIGLTTNVILPLLGMGIEHTTRFAPLSAITLVVIIAYAIIRHGLFDIKLAAVRTVAYILSITSLAVVYYAAVYLASTVLFQGQATSSVSVSPLNILLALILAFIFQPIKRFFDRTTDRVFFRDRYKADDFYARLSGILTTTTDLRTLLRRASEEVATTLKAQQAFFYIKKWGNAPCYGWHKAARGSTSW
jgi:hypothetical protein